MNHMTIKSTCANPRRGDNPITCLVCKTVIYVENRRKNTARFCSWKCGGKFNQGKKHTEEFKNKVRATMMTKIENHPMWKGNDVKLGALHLWVKRRLRNPKSCPKCGSVPKNGRSLDLANKSNRYSRDLSDWEWLCRSCHMKKDLNVLNFKHMRKKLLKGARRQEVLRKKYRPQERLSKYHKSKDRGD